MLLNHDALTIARQHAALPLAGQILCDAPAAFYFCGSRWMGGARLDSDWDFMTADTPTIRGWLRQHGFRSLWGDAWANPGDETHYPMESDGATTDVWELAPLFLGQPRLQVQLCADLERKFRTACFILEHHFAEHLRLDSAARSTLWREVYDRM